MLSYRFPFIAVMEDDTVYDGKYDQRDIMAYESQPFYKPIMDAPTHFSRFVAWSALNRAGTLKGMKWKDFEAKCIMVTLPDEEDPKA